MKMKDAPGNCMITKPTVCPYKTSTGPTPRESNLVCTSGTGMIAAGSMSGYLRLLFSWRDEQSPLAYRMCRNINSLNEMT